MQLIRIGLRGSRSNYSILLPNLNAPNKVDQDTSFDVIQGKKLYRVSHHLSDLGWVNFDLDNSTDSAWPDESLAEWAE